MPDIDACDDGPNYRVGASDGSNLTFTSANSGGATVSTWQLVHGTWDGTVVSVYVDGSLNDSASGAQTLPSETVNIGIGSDQGGQAVRQLNGKEHSVRIASTIPSNIADFIASEWANQSNQSTFWTGGTVFVPGGGFQPAWARGSNVVLQ